MNIELHDNGKEAMMDSGGVNTANDGDGAGDASNAPTTNTDPSAITSGGDSGLHGNENENENIDTKQGTESNSNETTTEEGPTFDESFPPLSSQPDIMSISPKQALFYLHQSLTSLIKLHENLLLNRRDSPVVIDDDVMDSGSETASGGFSAGTGTGTGTAGSGSSYSKNTGVPATDSIVQTSGDASDEFSPINSGSIPPPSSSAMGNFQNSRRRSHRYSDISPISMSDRRLSSGGGSSGHHIKSNEDEDYDILSPHSPGGSSHPSGPHMANYQSYLRRQRKTTSLLAEAAEVASLVLQGGTTTLQDEYARLKKSSMSWPAGSPSGSGSSIPSSPATSPVSLRPSPSTGSVSSIQEQKLVIARRFWSKTTPQISVQKYLLRLYKYCPSSTSAYLSAGLYIYRLCIILQTIPLTDLSVHRLALAAIRIACKGIEDINHSQSRFAMAAGVSTSDLYRLEIALLFLLDFNIKVDHDALQRALDVWAEVEVQARHVLERPVLSPVVQ
ncbi:Pcl7p [Sugiyamaella lignohabitans]|uniref:Pcl7p n=1 Tax=Sugiyamaella lignohabitans TaxID=796027 RepID=A0A167EKT0_9ASCO|nr:Pcl7p [Sugiyamaella lignohabitans]ANB14192.1 Pcl7p [Sugiyamaella lignohabitans]